MSIDGFLVARSERSDSGQRFAYIGTGVSERTSNFGYEGPQSPEPTCMQEVDGGWVPLAAETEHLINMETGEGGDMDNLSSDTSQRLRTRWEQAGHLEKSLQTIARKYTVISPKEWAKELVEQSMSMRFLTGTETVLEIGGCIGRNSLVIASILNQHGGRLVTVEANPAIVPKLLQARRASGLVFDIISKPMSRQRMIVKNHRALRIGPSDRVPNGWREVATTTYNDVRIATGINSFDTLVIDCEGSFHGIFNEFPEVMRNVNKILIENDSLDAKEAEEIHQYIRDRGLRPIWSQELTLEKKLKFPKYREFWQCWVQSIDG